MIKNKQGFTIIELMIATSVLSVILLVGAVIVIGIGNLYTKGMSQARTQSAARTVINQLVSDIQSSTGDIESDTDSGTKYICIGKIRYTFVVNTQASDNQHVLWRDVLSSDCDGTSLPALATINPPTANGQELIPNGVNLLQLQVENLSPGDYKVTVVVGNGDPNDASLYDQSNSPYVCKGGSGSQYCATVTLISNAVQRVVSGT